MDIQSKEKCAVNLLNFNLVHLVAGIILKHPFLCHIIGSVNISGHVWRF